MPVTHEDILHWLQRSTQVLHENSALLTQLDSAIGDADHGSNMDRGFTAVSAKIANLGEADIGTLLKTVGTTLVSTVGGGQRPVVWHGLPTRGHGLRRQAIPGNSRRDCLI
ncbi:hypothetical protein KDH_59420 [Dictyobacter sp. S3.2.2.5]|uniref:DhaL domain-containing protein n=1 Tax=Dictyobacter halimunensis TaxID=3026934 RepID=A0ABQ6FXV2_9CHLR|nr:hypothetical protein KDH_59420 [Dictyobacter sp. S3.2.2.5]